VLRTAVRVMHLTRVVFGLFTPLLIVDRCPAIGAKSSLTSRLGTATM
jgi:hypothetical protein